MALFVIRYWLLVIRLLTDCCPNKNSFERSLKRFLRINLGEAEDQRFELFEPEGRVFNSPGASLRFIKKRFRPSEKGFGQQPVNYQSKDFQSTISD
jgi:hypothetical protein